jgi:plasmid stability protein
MASITIRNLDDSLKEALRRRAAGNRRSMEEEARQIIGLELRRDRSLPKVGLGTRIANLFADVGGEDLPIPPRTEMPRKPPFVDDDDWP